MPLPAQLQGRLKLPVIAAPMFLVSGPDLVVASCQAGIVGSFPALNQRTSEGFDDWLTQIEGRLTPKDAPYGVNLIVHQTNPRLEADLKVCEAHMVPLIITSLGAVADLVTRVHAYGGLVFHDVTTLRHARKAAEAGVDGLILVCAGAGGHAGVISPFALVPEVRSFFDGTIILAGCISDGRAIAAAQAMGADLAYLGTRFIATSESMAPADFKAMIGDAAAADIVYTASISGVPANFLRQSLIGAGLDPDNLPTKKDINMGEELDTESKAWKNIWSAGQGVGGIEDAPATVELVERLAGEYRAAIEQMSGRLSTAAE
ncbi:MAG: NAD(P)H-dependent flavin oxidoreductase [Alphaproteobacteria bacterium]